MATLEELEARLTTLETEVANIRECSCDPSKYASQAELDKVRADHIRLTALVGTLPEDTEATTVVEYVDEKTTGSEYRLPYTAAEVVEKLGQLE